MIVRKHCLWNNSLLDFLLLYLYFLEEKVLLLTRIGFVSFWWLIRSGFIDEEAMNIIEVILQAITIGLVVAYFLLNTGRALKAIEVCKECLIVLNNEVLQKEKQFVTLSKIRIYVAIVRASCIIANYTSAISYGRKLLDIYRERGETAKEGP